MAKGFSNNVTGRVGVRANKAAEFHGRNPAYAWVAEVSNHGTSVAIGWGPTPKAARHDAIKNAQASAAAGTALRSAGEMDEMMPKFEKAV